MARKKLSEIQPTGVLAERRHEDGRRHLTLNRNERRQLERRQRAEAAAALFLDLEHDRSYKQIAEELNITPAQLKELTKWPEFDEAYNQLFAEIGHDPRFRAAQGALADMLPLAIRELKRIITSPGIAPGTRLKAIQEVLRLNGLTQPPSQSSDRMELAKFLKDKNINLTQVNNIAVPPEYLQEYTDLIEGEFKVEADGQEKGENALSSEPQEGVQGDFPPHAVDKPV